MTRWAFWLGWGMGNANVGEVTMKETTYKTMKQMGVWHIKMEL
jgi:hypothetical protein